MKQFTRLLLPLLVLLGAVLLRVHDPVLLSELRMRVFDTFQRISPRPYVDTPVRVIDLDNETLQRFGQWPWPRSQTAELIKRLTDGGASAIALDIVFAERDRTAPEIAFSTWGLKEDDPLRLEVTQRVQDPDEALAQTISNSPVILGFILVNDKLATAKPKRKGGLAATGMGAAGDPRNFVPKFRGAVASLPLLQAKARGQGSINVLTEGDAIVRRLPGLVNGANTLYPSLVTEALRVSQKTSTIVVKGSGASGYKAWWQKLAQLVSDSEGIGELKIGRLTIPTDRNGQIWLYDSGRIPARTIPAWKVMAGEDVDVKGKILFIGTSAPGLLDIRATPTDPVTPGVEIHAQITEQILSGVSLIRPYWTTLPELIFLLVMGIAMISLQPYVGPLGCALLGFVAMALALAAAWYAFIERGQLFDPVYPGIAALLVFIISAVTSYFRADVEKRAIREAFGRYLAPEMVKQLSNDPSKLRLGGELRLITILFCDIRDFTSISERNTAQQLTQILNRFLTPMTDAVLSKGGTIDKYIGDSVMAFWNAPLDDPAHASNACLAALEMRRRLALLNAELSEEAKAQGTSFEPLRMGIGINSGPCLVGNLGSAQRFSYSVIGDDVNLASRIEGLTKNYGIDIMIGGATQSLVSDLALLQLGEVTVKGKLLSTKVFALVGDKPVAADPHFQLFSTLLSEAIAAIRIGDARGAARFAQQCRATGASLGLDALFEHMDAAIARRQAERSE